jgi:hypothetical protein
MGAPCGSQLSKEALGQLLATIHSHYLIPRKKGTLSAIQAHLLKEEGLSWGLPQKHQTERCNRSRAIVLRQSQRSKDSAFPAFWHEGLPTPLRFLLREVFGPRPKDQQKLHHLRSPRTRPPQKN